MSTRGHWQRYSDRDALSIPPENSGERNAAVSRRRNTHHTHQLDGAVPDSLLAHAPVVDPEHLGNLITNGVHGSQRGRQGSWKIIEISCRGMRTFYR